MTEWSFFNFMWRGGGEGGNHGNDDDDDYNVVKPGLGLMCPNPQKWLISVFLKPFYFYNIFKII